MSYLTRWMSKAIFSVLLLTLLHGQAFGAVAVSNCHTSLGNSLELDLIFSITSNTAAITPGTQLVSQQSQILGFTCTFPEGSDLERAVFFKSTLPESTKEMLINSGVEVYQRYSLGSTTDVNITASTTPSILLGNWSSGNIGLGIRYFFTVKKGANALKPFDTGRVLIGHHTNYLGDNIGAPVYARFKGELTLLCPSPEVNIIASNGGSVGFGTVSPQRMNAGDAVSKSFNLNMAVNPGCETGLNVSVRFEPNNNTILENKYLDMGNGLQVLLNNTQGDVSYNEIYPVGELLPNTPVNLPYTATLTKIPGSSIASGPFSKTIRVVVSY